MTELLEKAIAAFNALPPDQQRQMLEQTRKSFAENNVALSRPAGPVEDLETWTDDELWQIVNEFDDRTSPEEYPEMIMLNEAEFRDFLERGRAVLQAENAALTAQLAKTEAHVEAVKNTLSVRCTDVAFLEERCKMLENELSAPKGYRVIPKHPTETMLWTMAFNLSSEFGCSFTLENKPFALAVYKQAWEMGIRLETKASPSAQAEAIIAAERAENEALKAGIKRLSDEQELLSETTGWDLISVVRLAARVSEAEADNAALTARVKELSEINVNLMGDDEDKPRYTTKRLKHEIASATKALETKLVATWNALEPFALISSEGVISTKSGHVTVTTCAEYFHDACAALEAKQ